MDGWLQKDVSRGAAQQIGVRSTGFSLAGGWAWHSPLWFEVTLRRLDATYVEIAVQGYGDIGHTRQLLYGRAVVVKQTMAIGGSSATVNLAWDWTSAPVDVPPAVGWPLTGTPVYASVEIDWATVPAAILEEVTYSLAWWWDMIFNFTGGLKTQIELMAWGQTTDAGYNAPNATVLMVDDALEVSDIRSKLKDGLVVIHSAREVRPDAPYLGGSGRKGRVYEATITLLAISGAGLTGSLKEEAMQKVAYMAEDLVDKLAPPRDPNLLSDWLYFSELEMVDPVRRADEKGIDGQIARADFIFRGYKIQLVTVPTAVEAGDGVAFNFNLGFLTAPAGKKMNDHALVYVPSTGLYHDIGIICDIALTGSELFHHHTSPDLRTWTDQGDIQVGTGVNLNWRCQVWAPHIIPNPGYGLGGALSAYKWLMFFTGANWVTTQLSTSEQKIGLAGCTNDDLDGWTVLNGDAPIYWTKIGGVNASWAWNYDTAWIHYTRDPHVFTDGSDWYMAVTAQSAVDATRLVVGLAKFAGGTSPDFTDCDHEPSPILVSTTTGNWAGESTFIQEIDSIWHLLMKGGSGSRHQSGASMFGPPWATSSTAGTVLMAGGGYPAESGGSYGEAPELVQLESLVYAMSGHLLESTDAFYFHAFIELDFEGLVAGGHPTVRPMCGVVGLVGTDAGVMDLALRWTIIDSQGSAGAFYRQPVWGDQALAAGYAASGMDGNAYIATRFRQYAPGAGLDGVEWSDDTRIGAIQSSNFTISKNRMSLMVGGGNHPSTEFIALCRADDDTILFSETGLDDHTMTQRLWDLTDLQGLEVYLVIVDNETSSWGNISVDAILEYNETDNLRDGAAAPLPAGGSVTGLLPA